MDFNQTDIAWRRHGTGSRARWSATIGLYRPVAARTEELDTAFVLAHPVRNGLAFHTLPELAARSFPTDQAWTCRVYIGSDDWKKEVRGRTWEEAQQQGVELALEMLTRSGGRHDTTAMRSARPAGIV